MTDAPRKGLWARLTGKAVAPPAKPVAAKAERPAMRISELAVGRSMANGEPKPQPFKPASIPPFIKEEMEKQSLPELAMDSGVSGAATWAGSYWGPYGYSFTEGLEFLGYPYLAELAQRPEYRRMVEIMAQEMTRKWIRITTADDGDDDKKNDEAREDKIAKIVAEMDRLNTREVFKMIAEQDGFFGRAHLYIDTGDSDNLDELKMPIGNGDDKISRAKVNEKKPVKALRPIEAVWTYPTSYNSNDPLKGDWYNPDMWFVMGKQVHVSRLLPFIGRPVPDLLKPAYSFGGLALTQMAKPYVDNWLQTRQSVNDIISAFTAWVLKTNMSSILQAGGGEAEAARAALFNNMRNNRGLMMVDMETEDFDNISVPLSGLHELQAQSQEHMSSVAGLPLIKLLGITPAGLNASSEGEIRVLYDTIGAVQEAFFRDNLTKVLCFIQLSLFGEVDPAIVFQFEPLYSLTEKEQAEARKFEAEMDTMYIDGGVVSPDEVRKRLASDPDSLYQNLAAEDADETDADGDAPNLLNEEEEGLKTDRPFSALDRLFGLATDAGWNESDHPREPDGKFGSGGSSAGAKASASKGAEAMSAAISEHRDVMGAMVRPELGLIDFRWGDKAGGVAHIIDKHGEEAARKMPEVIANGTLHTGLTPRGRPRVQIEHDGWVAALAPEYQGEAGHWLVTGFEKVEKKATR